MPRIARAITQWQSSEIPSSVRKSQKVFSNAGLDVKIIPRSLPYARTLIIISKRVGKASVRNKIRRRIKALFYQNRFFEGQYDWIIFVKPSLTTASFSEIEALLQSIQKKLP